MVYSIVGDGEYFECGVGGQNKGKKVFARYRPTRRSVGRKKKKKTEKGDIIEIMEKTRHQAQDRKKMIHQLQPETEMGGTNEQVKLKKTST